MNNEELKTFVKLFDTAMTSDNPTVKKAFKNLMIVSALVNAETHDIKGPLETIVEDLHTRVSTVETQLQRVIAGYYNTNTTYPIADPEIRRWNSFPTSTDKTITSVFMDEFFHNTMDNTMARKNNTGNV